MSDISILVSSIWIVITSSETEALKTRTNAFLMNMKTPKVLTIIVTYNGIKWIEKCLTSIKNSTISSDIYIVDNGSTDGTVEYIVSNFPKETLVISDNNQGFGRANNCGLDYAIRNNYDYVYLLNQDAWIDFDTLETLINISQENPQYAILSPLQVNRKKDKLDSNFSLNCPLPILSDLLCKRKLEKVYETNFVMAAHWLIPVNCIKLIGGFSPAFPHYGEDGNYVHRVVSRNMKIGIVPSAIGVHDRENRVIDKEKKMYLTYIHNLTILNNPLISHRIKTVLINYISILVKNPSEFRIKYLIKILSGITSSKNYLRMYSEKGPFLFQE